jgi:hypothetical protein
MTSESSRASYEQSTWSSETIQRPRAKVQMPENGEKTVSIETDRNIEHEPETLSEPDDGGRDHDEVSDGHAISEVEDDGMYL